MVAMTASLPDLTFVIEWENAIDVVDQWTCKAMTGLARELASVAPRLPRRPTVMYLYNSRAVSPATIERTIEQAAPELRQLAEVVLTPTEGLTYYKLKNYGIARARTALSVMIDSDAIPSLAGSMRCWRLSNDPSVMAVGGFTMLGHDDFLSRAMALTWIFDLKDEAAATERRNSIHVNNCASGQRFFRAHPFPDLPAFKKQCVMWLRAIRAEGHGFVRTAAAKVVHAPHPGIKFLVWRAWTAGLDSDFLAANLRTANPLGRMAYAFVDLGKSVWRAWSRIALRADAVAMPLWERPFALVVALAYYSLRLVGQLVSSLTRKFGPLPSFQPMDAIPASHDHSVGEVKRSGTCAPQLRCFVPGCAATALVPLITACALRLSVPAPTITLSKLDSPMT